jgi:hypothetical protein
MERAIQEALLAALRSPEGQETLRRALGNMAPHCAGSPGVQRAPRTVRSEP